MSKPEDQVYAVKRSEVLGKSKGLVNQHVTECHVYEEQYVHCIFKIMGVVV